MTGGDAQARALRVLGLQPDATTEEVKSAWRRLALLHHPDRATTEVARAAATEEFRRISDAYAELTHGPRVATAGHGAAADAHFRFRSRAAPRFTNTFLAALLAVPLALTGVRMGLALQRHPVHTGRVDGLLQPPRDPLNPEQGAVTHFAPTPAGGLAGRMRRAAARVTGRRGASQRAAGSSPDPG